MSPPVSGVEPRGVSPDTAAISPRARAHSTHTAAAHVVLVLRCVVLWCMGVKRLYEARTANSISL